MTATDIRNNSSPRHRAAVHSAPAFVRQWLKRRRILGDYRALQRMPDHRLSDMGLTRDDIASAEGRARLWLDLDRMP